MFLSEWHEFPSAPCLAGKKNLMTARVSMLLKSRASLTCFRACFLPGRLRTYQHPIFVKPLSLKCNRVKLAEDTWIVIVHTGLKYTAINTADISKELNSLRLDPSGF